MKIKERVKQVAVLTMAGIMVTSGVVNAAEVKPAVKTEVKTEVKDTRPALTRYTEELAKINTFPERNGKKSFRIVEPEEVLRVDNALQEYIDYALLTRNPGKKAEDIVKNNFSFTARPTYYAKTHRINSEIHDVTVTHVLESALMGGFERKPEYTAKDRSIKAVEGYNPYAKVSKAQLEKGIQLAAEVMNMDMEGIHIVLSPYNQSGLDYYIVTDTHSPIREDGDTGVQRRMARVVIEANPETNILAAAIEGLAEVEDFEVSQDLMNPEELYVYDDEIYKGITRATLSERAYKEGLEDVEINRDISLGEDKRIYIVEEIKGKDKEIDKIIEADKDRFYKKRTVGYPREGREEALAKYFKELSAKKPKIDKQPRQPELKIDLGKQGQHTLMGTEYMAGFRRLATTEDKIILTLDYSKTKHKVVKVVADTKADTDFAYDDERIVGKEIKRGANNQYIIKLPKGKTTVDIRVKPGAHADYDTSYAFDIIRK